MSIDSDKMIQLVMTVISSLIDKGWKFRIEDKYVDGTLILDDYGFCVLIGEQKIYVSPMYVIDLLIRSYYLEQEEFIYISYKSFFEIDYSLSTDNVYKSPSWVRIVYFLKRIENSYLVNEAKNWINADYVNLKKYLSEVDFSFFNNVLVGLNNKSCSELANLSDTDSTLAKKIEALYYLEAFFIQYLKDEIEDEIEIGEVDKQAEQISLEDYKVELVTFFRIIKMRNDYNILENDLKWLNDKINSRTSYMPSLFGGKNEILPSSLEASVAYDNYSLRKKADYFHF